MQKIYNTKKNGGMKYTEGYKKPTLGYQNNYHTQREWKDNFRIFSFVT